MRHSVKKAFTLVEILIVVVILGILAAIVVPQFTNASSEAQAGNVATQLQTIRSQIELYRVKNNGDRPASLETGGAGDVAWADLIADEYMRSAPMNPRTRSTAVAPLAALPAAGEVPALVAGDVGWLFHADSGQIFANGFDEIAYSEGLSALHPSVWLDEVP